MGTLRNHPGYWMRDDAEASLARWEADHGIIGVNSAGRYEWEQQELINRWNQGGTYNRPPYLYEPKRPARASAHVANGGVAFDTSEHTRFRRTCADYGWWQPYDWDVVHFEYDPKRDKRRGGSVAPATPNIEEEEEMSRNVMYRTTDTQAKIRAAVLNDTSGLWIEFTANDAGPLNNHAKAFNTGDALTVSSSMFSAARDAAKAARTGK